MLNATASHDGRTPLHVACLEGQLSVIRHLLANGASPHVTDHRGQTPLHGAIRSANVEAILLLREFGAHLGPTTMDTALEMCALAADDNVDALRSWYLAGVNFNIGDYDRRTALHVVSFSIKYSPKRFGNFVSKHPHDANLKSAKLSVRLNLSMRFFQIGSVRPFEWNSGRVKTLYKISGSKSND